MMESVDLKKAQYLVKRYVGEARRAGARGDEGLAEAVVKLADEKEPFFDSGELSTEEYGLMMDRMFVAVQEEE